MMHYIGNKRYLWEYVRTMSAINIDKMTFKDAKLKQKNSLQYLELFWSQARILGSLVSGTQKNFPIIVLILLKT